MLPAVLGRYALGLPDGNSHAQLADTENKNDTPDDKLWKAIGGCLKELADGSEDST